jgi:Tol biopolymer transport system component
MFQAYVLFSPDGKRFAYVKKVPGGMGAVIDGKVGRAYDSIGVFQFSPDSRHDFYVGLRNLNFVVLDGQEMQGEGTVTNFLFSQTGGRFAYLAYSPQAGYRMVIDGKQSPRFQEFVANSMSFSADGKHYAYATHVNFSQCSIIRDGVSTNVPSLVPFTTRARPGIDFPPLFFSGDGTRLVWAWPKSDGVSGNVISINSQEITHGHGAYEFPGFSPDSKRFATMIWNGHTYALSVDGKAGTTYDDFLEVNPNAARFLDSHTYRFLGVKGGMVYRVTENLGG